MTHRPIDHLRSEQDKASTVTAEVFKAVKSARYDANLTDALPHTMEIKSNSCPRASKPLESNCVTGTPGNCVAWTSSIDISSSLLSWASSCVSGTYTISVHTNRTNEHSRVRARARVYRARHGDVARGNNPKFVAKKGRKTVSGRRER